MLGLHAGEDDFERGELVLAHAPVEEILVAFAGIEAPLVPHLDDRHREGLLVLADLEHGAAVALGLDLVRLFVEVDEPLALDPFLDGITRRDERLARRSEDLEEPRAVAALVGGGERRSGFLGGGETPARATRFLPLGRSREGRRR